MIQRSHQTIQSDQYYIAELPEGHTTNSYFTPETIKPFDMWLRTKKIIIAPGISEQTVIAMTKPISVLKLNKDEIAMLIGLPLVTVNIRANTTSTQENIKQKNAVTPIPGASIGISFRMKNLGNE